MPIIPVTSLNFRVINVLFFRNICTSLLLAYISG